MLLTLADTPWPANSGKRLRSAAVLRAAARLDVSLDVVVVTRPDVEVALPPDVSVARSARVLAPLRSRFSAAAASALHRLPWQVGVVDWAAARRALRPWTQRTYDLVWYGAIDHAVGLRGAVSARRVVIDVDDVETAKIEAYLSLPPGLAGDGGSRLQRCVELPLWRGLQRRAERLADALVVCSELDRSRLGGGPQVQVVPNTYDAPAGPRRAPQDPPEVLLVANFAYEPNRDAAVVAAEQVLPALRARIPQVRLRLVGRGADHLPPSLADVPGVDVVGEVRQVAPELMRAAVAVVPVRYGGGTRIKVLEAFAHGVPVVSTALGCEGLDAVDGQHLLVRDRPEELAAGCAEVILDAALAERLGASGRDLVLGRFSQDQVDRSVGALAGRLLPPRAVD
jgi:glycosyltransferase involved in cell wall biosynthesis